jgi:uroporphyrinogen III methyltransferase/synthase
MSAAVRIGTRGSQLALWQANEVARLLSDQGHRPEIVTIRTTGDKRQDISLASVGGKGVFIKELEEALARGEIDLAVHSLKDVPSIVPPQFTLAAFLERADPRDAWVQIDATAIAEMPPGSTVGTSAPRRRAQLRKLHPHVRLEEIRGNVDTRINKLRAGLYDGAVLASAGLKRLGRESDITSYFAIDEMVPAAGQGIVVIETATNHAREIVAALNHPPSALAAACERGVLQKFGDLLDCYSAVAVHATIDAQITIRAFFGELNGDRAIRVTRRGKDPEVLMEAVYQDLVAGGALELAVRGERASRPHPPSVSLGGVIRRTRRPPNADETSALRTANRGKVFLVGAGPGDPNLLTLRAAEVIESAEVVAADALLSPEILARVPKTAELVYVGKRAGAHSVPQQETNRLLIDKARQGKQVVRLKGGDPFVFGRGGEEAEELAAASIDFEIVPGISSAIAGPAYAGIPVTHRAHATSVTLVTGHESEETTGIDWGALAQLSGTIVFLMGAGNLPLIVRKLREHGAPPARPVGVISRATTAEQKTVTGTLESIEQRAAGIATPALVVIGEVVQLHETINWFESKPLFGKRIVVTRAREQASELKRLLESEGALVVQFPTIEVVPPSSYDSLDRVIRALDDYQWVIFTSTNGVAFFFERLRHHGEDARALAGVMVAAVGEATADDLRARGIEPDLVPPKFQSTALIPLLDEDQRGIRTAVVRAAEGREELIDELRRRGGEVDVAIAYQTRRIGANPSALQDIDIVTFTSASTVDNFFDVLPDKGLIDGALLASIGPMTSDAIRRHGHRPDIEAQSATIPELVAAILRACRAKTS